LDRATLSEATNVIMDAITELVATLRGEKPPAVRWDPSEHNQSTHGRFVERGGAGPRQATRDSGAPNTNIGDSTE
jgi:1-acyl-sn-glycerol-3-phosphate acyltransferase